MSPSVFFFFFLRSNQTLGTTVSCGLLCASNQLNIVTDLLIEKLGTRRANYLFIQVELQLIPIVALYINMMSYNYISPAYLGVSSAASHSDHLNPPLLTLLRQVHRSHRRLLQLHVELLSRTRHIESITTQISPDHDHNRNGPSTKLRKIVWKEGPLANGWLSKVERRKMRFPVWGIG